MTGQGIQQLDLAEYGVGGLGDESHPRAMQAVKNARGPIPLGYRFSHYLVQGSGFGQNFTNAQEALSSARDILTSDFRLEVLAIHTHVSRPFFDTDRSLSRSIFYADSSKGVVYLSGLEVIGRHDIIGRLEEAILSYRRGK